MKTVTFQVLEGVDKGRVFRDLPIPVTIGREEGNLLRLNDERISRFHAKVQCDNEDVILTDLDSTNGTRINGHPVQIRRLQPGDRVGLGRSVLIFGSNEEIAARVAEVQKAAAHPPGAPQSKTLPGDVTAGAEFDLEMDGEPEPADPFWASTERVPHLPRKLSPSQAARLAELFDYLHRHLAAALAELRPDDEATHVTIAYAEWQKIQTVQMLLARYLRAVADPDALVD
jgi:pSer/pThr/pTyr-binding forkhead associated (FHA) protein